MPPTSTSASRSAPRSWARHAVARERGGGYRTTTDDRAVRDLDRVLAEVCDAGRLAALADDDLAAQVDVARRLEGTAALLTARVLRERARRGGGSESSASADTEWLKSTGRSGREAARSTRLASTLDQLPGTADALASGRIGTESADTIVRAAGDRTLGAPDQVEASLLPVADGASPEDLRAEVRRREQQVDPDAMLRDERLQHARRRLTLTHRDDGMWDLYGRLTGESGARMRTWLDAFEDPDPADTAPADRRRPDQRMADALDRAVGAALDAGTAPAAGGVSRPHLSVLVDVTTFDAVLTDPDHPDRPVSPADHAWRDLRGGDLEWGGALSPQAVRRICCDAAVSRVVMAGDSQVLDVGRTTRRWSAPQRRAIRVRDRHCRGPHCRRPIGWTEIHHLRWWRHDGPTDLANGLSLCHACHRLIHDVGWHAHLDIATAAVTWTTPDRRRTVVAHPRPPA